MSKEEAESRAKEAIELVGLNFDEVKDKSPFELSGGQKRRVAIAGIIASMPQVLVLDEPTAGLDPRGKRDILELVTKLKKSYCKTVIMISHNMDEIAEYCNRVIVLNNGKLLYDTTPRELFKDVKALEGTGLTPPHTAKIASLLANNGIIFSDLPLTVDEFVKAIKGGIAL